MTFEKTERVNRLIDGLMQYRPSLCRERAALYNESYERTKALPAILRRAKALEHILSHMSIYILEDELIVGNQASRPKAAPVFPEVASKWLLEELDGLPTRRCSPFAVEDGDREELRRILKNWDGRSVNDRINALLPEDVKHTKSTSVILYSAMSSGIGHMIIKNQEVLANGLRGLIETIGQKRSALTYNMPEGPGKLMFYDAALIVLRAIIRYAHRYAELAAGLAEKEHDPVRRKELQNIAKICKKVPEHPAHTFQEALQSMFFVHLALNIETNGHSISPGRLDQFMYPYYKADRADGLPEAYIQELLDCLWIKYNHLNKLRDGEGSKCFDGYPMFQNILVGGVDSENNCAVNELSYLCLRATEHVRMPMPSLSVRISYTEPEEFLRAAAEIARLGLGMPAFFNDEVLIPTLVHAGYTEEEARGYAEVGCVEPQVPATTQGFYNAGYVCFAKCLEIALHNGRDPITGLEVGPKTGDPGEFASFEQLMDAYETQFRFFCTQLVAGANIIETVHRDLTPSPFASCFIDSCIDRGLNFEEGGARYNFSAVNGVGLVNAADSLAAIKRMVYEEKRMTLAEMIETLDDAERAEALLPVLRSYPPKYGNDDDFVDTIAVRLSEQYFDFFENAKNVRGGHYIAGFQSISTHIAFSEVIGNTPDGKRFGEVLADGGVSAAQGRDTHGVTALMRSVSKIDQTRCTNGTLFNIKLNPSVVEGEHGLGVMVALIRSFLDLKIGHMQFNIVDHQTLLDAQEHPEKYGHLVVRVAGFSVYFTAICKELQEDIIARTEHV